MSALNIPTMPPQPDWLRAAILRGLTRSRFLPAHPAERESVVSHVTESVVASQPTPIRWTDLRPAAPGFYWVKAPRLSRRVANFYLQGRTIMSDYGDIGVNYGQPAFFSDRPLEEPL